MGPWHFPTSLSGRQLPGVVPAQPFRCLGRGTCGHEQDNSFSDWPGWHGFKNEPTSNITRPRTLFTEGDKHEFVV